MKNFVRKKENFGCKVCKKEVKGAGYTNHCPNCLWSRHVDEEVPGDRSAQCKGLMEPIGVEIKKDEYVLTHRCTKCGKKTRNKTAKEDKLEEIKKLF